MTNQKLKKKIEKRFLKELRHHLAGWRNKIEDDFSHTGFTNELRNLKSDPVYEKMSLATPEYVLVRLMGRISISIGRRLGEIYDKIPRYVAAARFDITPAQVAPKIANLELDIGLRFSQLSDSDETEINQTVKKFLSQDTDKGIGIEIRYNFNPNDSARLRKDVKMAKNLKEEGLTPIYLIFSSISPRAEAISRLKRAGWNFLIGSKAVNFTEDLLYMNLANILDKPSITQEIDDEIEKMMDSMINSFAFQEVLKSYGINN